MTASTNFARVKDIESAANKSKAKYTALNNTIGTLANLETTDNTSIVAAINETVSSEKVKRRPYILVLSGEVPRPPVKTNDIIDMLDNPSAYEGEYFTLPMSETYYQEVDEIWNRMLGTELENIQKRINL